MGNFFFNLGRSVNATLRKGKWLWQSFAGSEDEALRAEYELGRDLARSLSAQMEPDPDPDVVRFVGEVAARLADCVRDRRRRFCASPVLVPEVNAFALPGGFVFVTRPLLQLCAADPHEVAFVLAHEMAHVLHGHAMERVVNGWMLHAAGRALPLRGWAGGLVMQQVRELADRAYSREQELEADLLGARLAGAAGFDARAALRLLSRLPPAPAGTALHRYFATHPPFVERLANLRRVLRG
jgi:predicted Zn-dependent protease